MGSTGRFQQGLKQKYFRNVLNLAVSTLGQKEADNLLFAFPFLLGFAVLQGSGSHRCADTRCGALGPRNALHFLWDPRIEVTCWVGRCFNRQETEQIKVWDQLLSSLTTPGLWCVPEEDHKFVGTQTSAGRTPGLSVTQRWSCSSLFLQSG